MTKNEVNELIYKGWGLDRFFTVGKKKVFLGYGWRGKNDEIISPSQEDINRLSNGEIKKADLEKKYGVVRKEEKYNDIPVLAESEDDFHFILEREAKRLSVPIETVAEYQSEPVRKMWEEWKNIYKNDGLELNPEFLKYQMRIDGFLNYCKKVAKLMPNETSEDAVNPEDYLIRKMIPKINSDIFHFSTEQQWKDFRDRNFLDLKIVIKQNTQLKKAVAVIDVICEKLNVSFTLTELEQYNIFTYKGKTLKSTQYRDARDKIHPDLLTHYFE